MHKILVVYKVAFRLGEQPCFISKCQIKRFPDRLDT